MQLGSLIKLDVEISTMNPENPFWGQEVKVTIQTLTVWVFALLWVLGSGGLYCGWCMQLVMKGKERKSIYIAPFIYYVYLKALRHGSHSFTCKYTMPAFTS